MARPKLLLADDHQLFIEGIISLLATEEDLLVGATATDGKQVMDLLSREPYDVCILDIDMPLLNGIETAKLIKERNYDTKIIMLTMHNDKEFVAEMLILGVDGYVLKNATKNELVRAIRCVINGEKYFSDDVRQAVIHDYVHKIKQEKRLPADEPLPVTTRETEIIRLLAREQTNEQIANKLHISYRTVETHRKNIMHKTNTKNLAGLIQYAIAKGIIR